MRRKLEREEKAVKRKKEQDDKAKLRKEKQEERAKKKAEVLFVVLCVGHLKMMKELTLSGYSAVTVRDGMKRPVLVFVLQK